jgi:hypothetical protein
MSTTDKYTEQVQTNLSRIELCTSVLLKVQEQLLDPLYPEDKADLLLATEELAKAVYDLLGEVRVHVWGAEPEEDEE